MAISGKPGYGKFGSPDELDEDEDVCEESPSSELQLPLQLEAVEELPAEVPPPPAVPAVPAAVPEVPAALLEVRLRVARVRLRCAASLNEEAPLWRRVARRRGASERSLLPPRLDEC